MLLLLMTLCFDEEMQVRIYKYYIYYDVIRIDHIPSLSLYSYFHLILLSISFLVSS